MQARVPLCVEHRHGFGRPDRPEVAVKKKSKHDRVALAHGFLVAMTPSVRWSHTVFTGLSVSGSNPAKRS